MKIPPNTGHTIKKYPKLINGNWTEERDLVGWAELVIEGQVVRKEAAFSVYKQTKKDGSVTKFWQDMPTVMVEKVAEFQLLDAIYGLDGVMSIDAGYVADDRLENLAFLTDETESALAELGIKLQKYNGVAIAINYNGKEKYLEEFGFKKSNSNWIINYEEIPSGIEQKSKDDMPPPPQVNPANTLFEHLKAFGLNKVQIKEFVSDVLGLTSQDTEGIKEVLEDLSLLDKMVTEFMEEAKKPQIINDENTLF